MINLFQFFYLIVGVKKNPRKTWNWVGGSSPNSDFFFFFCVFFCRYVSTTKNRIGGLVGGV